jgi:Flp pilus assembly protein TadD
MTNGPRTAPTRARVDRVALRKPTTAETHFNTGAKLHHDGHLPEAIAAYRHALALRPDYPQAHNNLGAALQMQGRLEDAVAAYRAALASDPGFFDALNNLGYVLQQLGSP